ncbi:MAG: rane protein of unknown function [Acidobacteria bacterium]|nr:rane protein of unknown function [Acidobacteriota bacterium]
MANPSAPLHDSSWPNPVIAPSPGLRLPGRLPAAAWHLASVQAVALILALAVAAGALFRCYGLDYGGFSEDEVAKVGALRAYERGDFTANAEHPILMKAAMWASLAAARSWNRVAGGTRLPAVSAEAALRLPNALAGAAAVVPLFLLVRSFFGTSAALWASVFLALNVTVTGINRIGKEDTFLVLFLLLGAWLYEEARRRHLLDGEAPHGWYAASGAAFGLMLASKYLIYYLGLWALFGLAASAEARRGGADARAAAGDQRASKWFYLAIAGGFVAGDPVILMPATWLYGLHYVAGHTITHHGAAFAGQLYLNQPAATPWGLPWYFYLAYLVTKTPLPVLGAMGLGLVELVRRRRERGAVFARVFLIFFLLPSSLAASKFGRYLLPTLVVLDVVAALGAVRAFRWLAGLAHPTRALAAGALAGALVGGPLFAQIAWSPHQTLYQNVLGRAMSPPGRMFPNDELYDMGVREAVEWIAARAAPGASIASDSPGVVAEYLRRYGRPDLEARYLSMAGLAVPPTQTWLLASESHACFESIQVVKQVRARQRPDFVYRVRGTAAVEAYRLPW